MSDDSDSNRGEEQESQSHPQPTAMKAILKWKLDSGQITEDLVRVPTPSAAASQQPKVSSGLLFGESTFFRGTV